MFFSSVEKGVAASSDYKRNTSSWKIFKTSHKPVTGKTCYNVLPSSLLTGNMCILCKTLSGHTRLNPFLLPNNGIPDSWVSFNEQKFVGPQFWCWEVQYQGGASAKGPLAASLHGRW